MMKPFTHAVFILLCLCLARGEQQATIQVSDVSKAGSPITLSGTVSFEDGLVGKQRNASETCQVSGINVSGRNLLAAIVKIETFDFRGPASVYMTTEDYFFKPGLLLDGETMVVFEPNKAPHSETMFNPDNSHTPHAEARVLFSQFEDGTTWGDPGVGNELFAKRESALAFLKKLLTTYDQEGEDAFRSLVNEHQAGQSRTEAILHGLRSTLTESGADATLDKIRAMLRVAASRPSAPN